MTIDETHNTQTLTLTLTLTPTQAADSLGCCTLADWIGCCCLADCHLILEAFLYWKLLLGCPCWGIHGRRASTPTTDNPAEHYPQP